MTTGATLGRKKQPLESRSNPRKVCLPPPWFKPVSSANIEYIRPGRRVQLSGSRPLHWDEWWERSSKHKHFLAYNLLSRVPERRRRRHSCPSSSSSACSSVHCWDPTVRPLITSTSLSPSPGFSPKTIKTECVCIYIYIWAAPKLSTIFIYLSLELSSYHLVRIGTENDENRGPFRRTLFSR